MEALKRERVGAANADPNPQQKNRTPQERYKNTARSRRVSTTRVFVPVHVFEPEPGRITTTVVVACDVCSRRHVHYVRRAAEVSSVLRTAHCRRAKYRILLDSVPVPRTSPEAA